MEVSSLGASAPLLFEAWAAGIIEGEGTITFTNIKNRKSSKRCSISVMMTDKDVIDKLFDILKVGTIRGPYIYKNKPLWTWAVQNQKGCFDTLLKIMPYLSKRRLEKASEMFEFLEGKINKWI